jgi:hypothetical protein
VVSPLDFLCAPGTPESRTDPLRHRRPDQLRRAEAADATSENSVAGTSPGGLDGKRGPP